MATKKKNAPKRRPPRKAAGPVLVAPTRQDTPEEREAVLALPEYARELGEARKRGRPLLLTPAVRAQLAVHLRRGLYLETAARLVGVSRSSLHAWLAKGAAQKRGPFRDLLDTIEGSQARFEADSLERLERADEGGKWTAWRLERMFPERFGLKSVIQEAAQSQVDQEIRAVLDRIRERCDPATFRQVLEAIDDPDDGGPAAPPAA